MGDRASMKDVFMQCQTGLQGHGKLMKTLHKLYDKTDFETFWSEFNHYLKYAMIVFKREPAVERMIDFVAKFVPTMVKKVAEKAREAAEGDMTEDEEDSVADNRLLQEMFDFLLNSHSAKDRGVRFRCCQLINKLLTNLGEDAQIDDELYDRLYECMLERLKDKCPMVRYHAVMAMARLQDPTDENCPVIKAYLFLLNCDPNSDVRRAVLSSIAPSTKTLASIIGRSRDIRDTVRKTSYEVLSEKIHIKALSIALRLQLINEGLNDRSEIVQQACSGKLLQSWMRTFGGNILELLKSLDVEDSTDICSRVLLTLFKASSEQDMITSFDILDEQLLVPVNTLTSESALYWQSVCKFMHGMGTGGDEYMEKVMPTAVDFSAYMQRYVDELTLVDDPEVQLGREFIIEQLLLITSYMDTADVSSKKALETLLHNMLMADHVSHRLVKFIVVQICTLRGTGDNLVPYFAETVSEIREPIAIVEKDVEAEQKRQINLKIAGIRVQLNQLREDLDNAVREQRFEEAAEVKAAIAQLDTEKKQLLETSEPIREEIRTEKNDALTVLKCQTIISEMLQLLKLNTVSPTLQMMIESQIVPGIQNEDAEVRNMAMQALGLCCYLSKDLLVTYIPLFMQASQIDVEGVRVTALRVLFDLLLIYGLEIVDASEGSSSDGSSDLQGGGDSLDATTMSETTSRTDSRSGTASKLVAIVCSFLDGESSDLRTCAAEGLAKLLLSGRVVSSKILSHLILLWYNPLSEDDTHLRDCLGTFFPLYALASRSNQEVVEEAFLPTLRTLLNAPATSPLAEVDINNVAELLVQLTNAKLLTANQSSTDISLDNPGHDNLSETVCNEILSNPESSQVKLWVRILNQMDLSPDNEVVLKDLRILAYKMVKTVKERLCLKALQKFQIRINALASKFVTDNDDLDNIEIEPVEVQSESVEENEDSTVQTPRRKRVRGLYSQNMTLAMESESELDIAEDSTVDVDASCLMSRTSVETPARRGCKNTTTTELADDEVFTITEVPEDAEIVVKKPGTESKKQGEDHTEKEPANEPEESTEYKDLSPKAKSPKKKNIDNEAEKEKSPRSNSPEKRGIVTGKKITSPKKSGPKSPGQHSGKRRSSRSPAGVSPGKRTASESPAKKSQEKRKASKSPSRERKRLSKSPARSSSGMRRGSKSPEKRASSKSPIIEVGAKRKSSKSPVKTPEKRKESKSPVRGNGEKRKMSKTPVQSPGGKDSPVPAKRAKENSNEHPKSPKKKSTNFQKSPGKKITKDAGKSPMKNNAENAKAGSPERKKSASKAPERKNAKVAEMKTRNAVHESIESLAKSRVKSAPSGTVAKSPRTVRSVKASETGRTTAASSPRNVRKIAATTVVDTPDQTRRVSSRSVLSTPDTRSPRRKRTANEGSVAETPEHVVAEKTSSIHKQKKADPKTARVPAARTTGKNPTVRLTDIRSARRKSPAKPSTTGKQAVRTNASSASSTSDSSPEKPAKNMIRYTRGKTASSSDSVTSSPDSAKATMSETDKPSPVKKLVEVRDTTDEEEVSLRRKAKPSRRSATESVSVPVLPTPPASGRSTRFPAATGRSAMSPAAMGRSAMSPAVMGRSAMSPAATGHSARSPAATGRSSRSPAATGRSITSPVSGRPARSPAAKGHSVTSPPVSGHHARSPSPGRSTRSSLSLEVPLASSRQSRSGVPTSKVTRKLVKPMGMHTNKATTVPAQRNTRGDRIASSQDGSTLSLISQRSSRSLVSSQRSKSSLMSSQRSMSSLMSSQRSTSSLMSSQRSTSSLMSSQRSTVSQISQRSTATQISHRSTASTVSGKSGDLLTLRQMGRTGAATKKPTSRRPQSSDSVKPRKPMAPVTKATRSAVATKVTRETRPETGPLKRPLRSKLLDKK